MADTCGRRRWTLLAPLVLLLSALPPPALAGQGGPLFETARKAAEREFAALSARGLPGALVGVGAGSGERRIFAFGVADVETGAPMRPGHVMRIGSVAKLFLATLVLQLADEGRLSLDDPISRYVPDVPGGDRITLRMLGHHRSGLFNPIADPDFRRRINEAPDAERSYANIMTVVRNRADGRQPGDSFAYSNANSVLLGRAVEAATGATLTDLLAARIHRSFGAETPVIPRSAALPHADLKGYRFGRAAGAVEYGSVFFDATGFSASWAGAAGNMNATVGDLLRLAKPLASGATLSVRMRAALHDFTAIGPGFDYGFHIARFGKAIGHAGDVPGFSSFLAWLPDRDVSIVVLCNLSNLADKSAPAEAIGRAVIEALAVPGDQRQPVKP